MAMLLLLLLLTTTTTRLQLQNSFATCTLLVPFRFVPHPSLSHAASSLTCRLAIQLCACQQARSTISTTRPPHCPSPSSSSPLPARRCCIFHLHGQARRTLHQARPFSFPLILLSTCYCYSFPLPMSMVSKLWLIHNNSSTSAIIIRLSKQRPSLRLLVHKKH